MASSRHRESSDLVESVVPLAYHLAHRYRSRQGIEPDDLAQAGLEAVSKGMSQYVPDGRPFSWWAGGVMRNGMMNADKAHSWQRFGAAREDRQLESVDAAYESATPAVSYEADEWDDDILMAQVMASLHPLDRRILAQTLDGIGATEIGTDVGMTPQNVHKRLRQLRPHFASKLGISPS